MTYIESIINILAHLEHSIVNKEPFSLIRFGDGGLKLMHSYIFNDRKQLKEIIDKEGLCEDVIEYIVKSWTAAANNSDYIDSCYVYNNGNFWPRVRKNFKRMNKNTIIKIEQWKKIYEFMGIHNKNYCNPEINFLSCLDSIPINLLDMMTERTICCITSHKEALKATISDRFDIDYVSIVNFGEEHYSKCFTKVLKKIERDANNYHLWLVAAGELGRIYSDEIKNNGGRAFDVGSLTDYWAYGIIPIRLENYIKSCNQDVMKLSLTDLGNSYIKKL